MTAVDERPITAVAETEPVRGTASRERLLSLDVFRGATIAGMLLVNNPGTWSHIYPPLRHAEWHGWTATDLIFPFFLFIVGVTTHLSLSARRARGDSESALMEQVLRRGAIIIFLGLLLNWFPFFATANIADNPNPTFGDRVVYSLQHLRFPGVLQRIGICYIIAGLLSLRTTLRQMAMITAALLLGYWIIMTLIPVPGTGQLGGSLLDTKDRNLAAYTDRVLIGTNHLWRQAKTWDPEGPLSTIPAIATAILGLCTGRWIAQRRRPLIERIASLAVCGALAMMIGLMWNWVFPINKNLWTSSYVLFTGGMAALAIAACMWIIDLHNVRWWTTPFAVFGVNPILAFVGSGLMAKLGYMVKIDGDGIQSVIYRSLFSPFFAPKNASLLFAISFVLLWFVILYFFYRRGWFLRI